MQDNNKLRVFYDEVAQMEQRLSAQHPAGFVYLTSIDCDRIPLHRAGVTVMAAARLAALCVMKKTHRVATPEEIEAHDREMRERVAHCEAQERLLRGGKGQVIVTNRLRSEIEGK